MKQFSNITIIATMLNSILILTGKIVFKISTFLNLGSGSTWPGHIALSVNKSFIKDLLKNSKTKIILIAGTNGKTTTSKLIQTILEKNGLKVFRNESGANLLNGIASSLLLHSNRLYDYALFEADENSLPLVLKELTPNYIILLNLFRDQLDRYGEVNIIAQKWKESLDVIARRNDEAISINLILNADDPQIAHLGLSLPHSQVLYFGLNDKTLTQTNYQHASDSTYCPRCGTKLDYHLRFFSHLGDWECKSCKLKRPEVNNLMIKTYPLSGVYNQYNTNAAVLFAKTNNINDETIEQALKDFSPAFGRQEILKIKEKKVQIFLAKNPTSFNESLRTINELKAKNLLLVLNDRIPDGRDVSWIWDVDFENYIDSFKNIIISGDRAYDMALRLKYSEDKHLGWWQAERERSHDSSEVDGKRFKIYENLKEAVQESLKKLSKNETLYILPTYSAMLEVRQILTGKKIL